MRFPTFRIVVKDRNEGEIAVLFDRPHTFSRDAISLLQRTIQPVMEDAIVDLPLCKENIYRIRMHVLTIVKALVQSDELYWSAFPGMWYTRMEREVRNAMRLPYKRY